ncbi:hypothetical protein B566_EDAN002103 [Ephemera danica]|nr:hypothetical protein B566_EDAN002103 [Ephemera danica]
MGADRGCLATRGPTTPRPLLPLPPPRLPTRASCTLRSLDVSITCLPWEVLSSRLQVLSFGHILWLTLPLPLRPRLPSSLVPQHCNTRPRSCTRHFTLRSQCDLTYDAPPKPPPPQPRRCHPSTCASRSQRTAMRCHTDVVLTVTSCGCSSQLCRFLIRPRHSAPCITRCLTSCPRPRLPRQLVPRVRSPARSNNLGRQRHNSPVVGRTTLPARRCSWPTSDSSCPSMSSKRSSAASPGSVVYACTPRVALPWRLSNSGTCDVPRRPWQRSRVASYSPRTAEPCVLSTRRARWPRYGKNEELGAM